MLQSLRIRQLAVIDDLLWELEPGLNVLTGETGAGKSILIDAFNLLLGERADKTLIRDGSAECSVEGLLTGCDFLRPMLEEAGVDPGEGGELLLKRTFHTDKPGRQWINGSPVTLQILKDLGTHLVDMHGPHDHQLLLHNDEQLKALDAFANLAEPVRACQSAHRILRQLKEEWNSLRTTDAGQLDQRLDFLRYQIDEIEKAGLKAGEEEELELLYDRASNEQHILELLGQCQTLINEGESPIMEQLAVLQRLLCEWERVDPTAAEWRELNESMVRQLGEMLRGLDQLGARAELDPARLKEVEARLDVIKSLKRKFGPSLDDVLATADRFQKEFDTLSGRDQRLAELDQELSRARQELDTCAAALSKARAAAAPKLARAITEQLRFLGFAQSHFEIILSTLDEPGAKGSDFCEYHFAPNPGEKPRPLKAVASSGEMARVMLAVKSVLASADRVPILIFDEVDANVGGETAVAVGRRLRDLAADHQVLCITHLPQVAAAGHVHYRVEKSVVAGRTSTRLQNLDSKDREEELARMLGGQSTSARGLARTLLKDHKDHKAQ
ncbi:MAG: DNA repair protein RecN [Candidatus Methylacidiphilales bacterium]